MSSNLFSLIEQNPQDLPEQIPNRKDMIPLPVSVVERVEDAGVKRPFFLSDDPKAAKARNPLLISLDDVGTDHFGDNTHFVMNEMSTWGQFSEILMAFASREYKAKADAPLFSPTIYQTIVRLNKKNLPYQGFRNEANATTSGLIVLDVEPNKKNKENNIPDLYYHQVEQYLTEHRIEAILYTTASNRDGRHFRIVIPLLEPVDPETHKAVVDAVCEYIHPGWLPDESKRNCYSLFYVPGRYGDADNQFVRVAGSVFPAQAWFQLGGRSEPQSVPVKVQPGQVTTTGVETAWGSYVDCRYVRSEWVSEYRTLSDGWYNGLYRLMCQIATGMIRRGVEPTPEQVATLAREIELSTGHQHKTWDATTRDLEAEAVNAVVEARAQVARTPTLDPPPLVGLVKPKDMSIVEWLMRDDTAVPLHRASTPTNSQAAWGSTTLTPVIWSAGDDDEWIEPRQWLMGTIFCRRFLSALFAGGGSGKSALRVAQAVALASGKPITCEHIRQRCRVLIVSFEDDKDELRRRIRACCLHHKIDRKTELDGWLFGYNVSQGKKLATVDKQGKIVDGGLAADLRAIVIDNGIDVMILDPFKKTHGCPENDNTGIDLVTDMLTNLAIELNIAVDVPHHVAKGRNDAGDADNGRGASALKDGARLTYTLTRMAKEEADKLGIDDGDRWRYIRVDSAKVNITPHATQAQWFKLVGVKLGNGNAVYAEGDNVQTVEPWTPIDFEALKVNEDLKDLVLDEIRRAPDHALMTKWGRAVDNPRHIWHAFARFNPDITFKQANMIASEWVKLNVIVEVDFKDVGRRLRKGLRVNEE